MSNNRPSEDHCCVMACSGCSSPAGEGKISAPLRYCTLYAASSANSEVLCSSRPLLQGNKAPLHLKWFLLCPVAGIAPANDPPSLEATASLHLAWAVHGGGSDLKAVSFSESGGGKIVGRLLLSLFHYTPYNDCLVSGNVTSAHRRGTSFGCWKRHEACFPERTSPGMSKSKTL